MKFQIKLLQNIILGHNKMFFFSFKDKKKKSKLYQYFLLIIV